jgi:cell division protein FtsI/penicillin-binding protein 2
MTTRRSAIATLFAAAARAQDRLAPFFEGAHGAAILIGAAARRPIAIHAPELAGRLLVPPGSTMKPFVLAALLESGKLRPADSFRCPGYLVIAGHNLACSHPRGLPPMQVRTAIAYSCNCFVAHFAERFDPGALARYGLTSRTNWIDDEAEGAITRADSRLLALGEEGILVTPAGLAMGYLRLARTSPLAIREGLEDAVDYGTAQRARVDGVKVAGKTGSVRNTAWFAGFTPKYAIAVMLQGRSGGADAAPIASRILEAACRGAL